MRKEAEEVGEAQEVEEVEEVEEKCPTNRRIAATKATAKDQTWHKRRGGISGRGEAMTGKGYYITTLGDWKRRMGSFSNSHWLLLDAGGPASLEREGTSEAPVQRLALPGNGASVDALNESARILVLVEADEGTHGSLEDDAAFEALPHPLAQKAISDGAQAALAVHGVKSGASTFEATEIVASVHPLLRHRVF